MLESGANTTLSVELPQEGRYLVLKLVRGISGIDVNGAAAVRTTLLLVLLLGKPLATSHRQVLPGALCISV